MSDQSARPWTRPHDWAEVAIGVAVLLGPAWLATNDAATWTMIILGALIAVDGLVSLAMPGLIYGEAIQVVLGALLFVSPWVMSYTEFGPASWVSWIAGAFTAFAGGLALPAAQAAHRGIAGQF